MNRGIIQVREFPCIAVDQSVNGGFHEFTQRRPHGPQGPWQNARLRGLPLESRNVLESLLPVWTTQTLPPCSAAPARACDKRLRNGACTKRRRIQERP